MNNASSGALIAFAIYTIAVFGIAVLSNRFAKGKEFAGEYFLGSRSFGVWAFALTFAATNASGGTFVGFPALIYTHGWTLALWIAGFMIMPLVSMAMIGKRLNQIARKTDAITIPEVLRHRFASPAVGLTATGFLVFFMFFYLAAQFKAGGKILSTLLSDDPFFRRCSTGLGHLIIDVPWVGQADPDYLLCLLVFSVAVIVYVVYGGFRAVVWTDVMQGIVMFAGVLIMLAMSLYQVGGLSNATRQLAKMTPPENGTAVLVIDRDAASDQLFNKAAWIKQDGQAYRLAAHGLIAAGSRRSEPIAILKITTPEEIERISTTDSLATVRLESITTQPYAYGAGKAGVYISNPGPDTKSEIGFLAIGTAFSFFVFWPFAATGQPSNMLRLMSFKDTRTLRYSVMTVAIYYSVIYFCLVIVFCCARVLMPGMEVDPDRTMPDLATHLATNAGTPWLSGLLVAAPFAAVMSSVDSLLLMMSSSVVRDIYHGHINPKATDNRIRRLSYLVTVVAGLFTVLAVLNPPTYLQDVIVFATAGLAACFLVPMVLALYWKGMTSGGVIAGMVAGTLMHVILTSWGYAAEGKFRAYEFLTLSPFIWDLGASAIAAVVVAKCQTPDEDLRRRFF
ncbi:sodium:solute symporter family transporter [Planctomycetes bacterium K23_9]|uniref:Sodium/pantothenate symporter n=1 Tax=Stieleria marina TaxID=1930275 RepID=A0A517P1L1_9BACT|nr:Sodium/pantothenate symporter [Planctomycetes bacterium K23_9]